MENKKGSGIFLGVVSVATLIVAIIGATFAFFSASMSSEENAIDVTAYEFSGSLSISQVYPNSATALIPLNPIATIANVEAPNNTNLLYALNRATTKCVDDAGFQICALYRVDFENNGTQPITLSGVIRTVANTASSTTGRTGATPFANLTYNGVTGSEGSFALEGEATTLGDETDDTISIGQVTIPGKSGETPGRVSKYMVIYLNDTGSDQSAEMGASYQGQLVYTSTTGDGNRLTGTFTVAGTGTGD